MWTLFWEGLCYLTVAALGVVGLMRRRWTSPLLFGLVWVVAAAVAAGMVDRWLVVTFARFAIMFVAGMIMQAWADRIPVNRWLVVAAAVAVPAGMLLPDYRLVAALPLAYLLIVIGARIRSPRLRLANDISYGVYVYAFPVQQSLAMLGLWHLGRPLFAVLSMLGTLPFAVASWVWVERPALRLKARRVAPAVPEPVRMGPARLINRSTRPGGG